MSRLLAVVLVTVLAISAHAASTTQNGNDSCNGCLVSGTCHRDGHEERTVHGITVVTCRCNGTDWQCGARVKPEHAAVVNDPVPMCPGCRVGNACYMEGYNETSTLSDGSTRTCTCNKFGWLCYTLGKPLYLTAAASACDGCLVNDKCFKSGQDEVTAAGSSFIRCYCDVRNWRCEIFNPPS